MKNIQRTTTFRIHQTAESVFPLFSPEGEKLWAPGWDYQEIMGSGGLHEDFIFLTRNHDHATTEAIWLVKKYEPQSFLIQFYKVEPGDKVGFITVQCLKLDHSQTQVEVTYRYFSLSEQGDRLLDRFSADYYETFIDGWRSLLQKYFEKSNTGKKFL